MRGVLRTSFAVGASAVMLALAGCTTSGREQNTGPGDPGKLTSSTSGFRERCYAGEMTACDELARSVKKESPLARYGSTCGGRVNSPVTQSCVRAFPQATPGKPVDGFGTPLKQPAADCEAGVLTACDELSRDAPAGTEQHDYGATCALRRAPVPSCVRSYLEPALPLKLIVTNAADGPAAQACGQGTMSACDALRKRAGTDVGRYGERCGGRTRRVASCVAKFEGVEIPPGLPLALPSSGAARDCFDGDLRACDTLRNPSAANDALPVYGATCGGRLEQQPEPCLDTYRKIWPKAGGSAQALDRALDRLNQLAFACLGSNWAACDELGRAASGAVYPDHARYGASCGGRVPDADGGCADLLSGTRAGSDPRAVVDEDERRLRDLAEKCHRKDWTSCAALAADTPPGYQDFRTYGLSCGGYAKDRRPAECVAVLEPPATSPQTTAGAPTTPARTTPARTTPAGPTADRGTPVAPTPAADQSPQEPTPEVPPETKPYLDFLDLLLKAIEPKIHIAADEPLKVGQRSTVTVGLDEDIPFDVPPGTLKSLGAGAEIPVTITPRLAGGANDFDIEPTDDGQVTLFVRLERRPTVQKISKIGSYVVTPKRAGSALSLSLATAQSSVNGQALNQPRDVKLGMYTVIDRPWWERFGGWLWKVLAALVVIAGGLLTIIKLTRVLQGRAEP